MNFIETKNGLVLSSRGLYSVYVLTHVHFLKDVNLVKYSLNTRHTNNCGNKPCERWRSLRRQAIFLNETR